MDTRLSMIFKGARSCALLQGQIVPKTGLLHLSGFELGFAADASIPGPLWAQGTLVFCRWYY